MEASVSFMNNTEVHAIEKKTPDVIQQASVLQIIDHEQEAAGVELIRAIKGLKKEVEDTFGPIKKKTHEAWKESVAQEKRHLEPLEAAEKLVRGKVLVFQDEQERLRKAEEERLAEIARKEQQKRIDAAAKRVNTLLKKGGDVVSQIRALEADLTASDLTDEDKAAIEYRLNFLRLKHENIESNIQQKQTEAEQTRYVSPAPMMPPPAPKVQGTSTKTTKEARIDNPMALIKAVAAETVPVGIITFDMKTLDKLVNAGAIIPGVSFTEKKILTVR